MTTMPIAAKRMLVTAMLLLAFAGRSDAAGPWALVTNDHHGVVHTLDLSTEPATVHGPFLSGQLGSGSLVDAVAEPNGRYVLVTNYDDQRLYRIDVLDPLNPQVAGSIDIGVESEEVAVAPNGSFAIVAASQWGDRLIAIDLPSFTIAAAHVFEEPVAITCVEIAPDSLTVIFCDDSGNRLRFGRFDPILGFETLSSLAVTSQPLNVAISPDGGTVLALQSGTVVNVFQITAPGVLIPGSPAVVSLSPFGLYHQSAAFSPAGDRAYVLSTADNSAGSRDKLSWIEITGPGATGAFQFGAANLLTRAPYWTYFGAEIVTVVRDGSVAYVGNNFNAQTVSALSRVDLTDFSVTALSFGSGMRPTATAIQPCVFCDGFETGDLSNWLSSLSHAQVGEASSPSFEL